MQPSQAGEKSNAPEIIIAVLLIGVIIIGLIIILVKIKKKEIKLRNESITLKLI